MTSRPSTQTLPGYHLQPASGWLNDPNGMVHADGRWHVFYQHNSAGPYHDAIEWGHASSSDLVTWRHHPVAFGPTPGGPDSFGCWSGVMVTGLDRPAVAYSGVTDSTCASTIVLRWGSADLEQWSEPIVVGHTPTDAAVRVMRDPFVFEWSGHRWALLGAGMDDDSAAVLVFSCDDILDWHYEGIFLAHDDPILRDQAPADIWECPQLVTRDESALLVVSTQTQRVLGDVVAVTGRIGTADAGHPVFEVVSACRLDEGNACYAPQVALDPTGGDPLMFGWVREEGYPDAATGHTHAGCLTLPRRITVRDGAPHVTVDPATAQLDIPTVEVGGIGPSTIAARVTTNEPTMLLGKDIEAPVPAGSTVWFDADVVEVYPVDGLPSTWRGTAGTWRLEPAPRD